MKRSRISPVSPARRRALVERRAVLARSHGPQRCGWPDGCPEPGTDPHEILTRARGGSIVDPDNIVLLCRGHHETVTLDTKLGERLGLVESRYHPRQSDITRGIVALVSETEPKIKQMPLRLPEDLVDAIDARRARVGGLSRNAWIEKALRWALEQPVRVQKIEERT